MSVEIMAKCLSDQDMTVPTQNVLSHTAKKKISLLMTQEKTWQKNTDIVNDLPGVSPLLLLMEWLGSNCSHSIASTVPEKYTIKIPYIYRKTSTQDLKPLNHYIMDSVVVKLFKKSCDDMSLEDALGEEEMVCAFFGTVEEGKTTLDTITEQQWETMD